MMTAENIHETIEIEVWLRTRPRVRYGMISTPFGDAILSAVNRSLVGLSFCDDSARGLEDLEVRWPSAVFIEDTEMATAFAKGIFRNGRIELHEEGVVLIGTEFQTSVWKHLMGIPSGTVATYSDVARGIGRPQAIRAVATAIGRNPIALLVPCHRIVPLAGGIGEYRWGRERKRNLIAREALAAT